MYRGNTSSQTNPIKHVEFGVNTNLSNNYSTQTDPGIFSNKSTNTQHPPQTSTQTDHRNNVEDHQCEMEEINQPLIPFQSNFARQLHQNE